MSETFPARRLPDNSVIDSLERPGDYFLGGVVNRDGVSMPNVWFLLPTADPADPWGRINDPGNREAWSKTRANGLHGVTSPPWTFRECADGSLEIRASIACGRRDPEGEYFHGYLDEGNVWRTC